MRVLISLLLLCGGCMTIHHQPVVLNVYQMPPDVTEDTQYDDCSEIGMQELFCDTGLRI